MSARRRSPGRTPLQERRRRVGRTVLGVAGGLLLLIGVVYAGTALLSGVGSSTSDLDASTPPPLLPGAPTVLVPPKEPPALVAGTGYDISYPQCGRTPPPGASFGIVGLNGGAPLLSNKCFAQQVAWARRTSGYAVYVNTAYPGAGDPVAYGRRLAEDAITRERAAGVEGIAMWWLDVEVTNAWYGTTQENATVLASMAARLQEAGVRVGIYSSPQQWAQIAGDWAPGLPVWNATGPGTRAAAAPSCSESFAGSTSAIVQWVQRSGNRLLDHNLVCPAWRTRGGDILDVSLR